MPCRFESRRPHQLIGAHHRQIKTSRSFDHRVEAYLTVSKVHSD
jgi:hypothetical protein